MTLTNQLEAYCSEKGYTYIDQLQVTDMDEFYAGWKVRRGSLSIGRSN